GDIYLVDESVHQVLSLLGELTGRKIISSGGLPGVFLNFDSQGPMTRTEAIDALESLLSLNGVAVAEMGESFLRVISNAEIKHKSPDHLYHSSALMAPSEKIYSKLFKVKYMKWEEGIALVNSNLTPSMGSSELFPSSKSILVKDSLVNIQQLESLFAQLDVPSKQEIIVKNLQFIASEELKTLLEQQLAEGLESFVEGKISITADVRSNQIIIVSDAKNKALLERLIRTYDVDTKPATTSRVVHIKHAEATEMVSVLNSIVQSQQNDRRNEDANTVIRPNEEAPPVNPTPELVKRLQFSEYLSIVSDERSNSIVIYGTPEDIEGVESLIAELDVILSQVRIDVIIVEVTLTNENSRGIEKFGVSYDENDEILFGVNEDSGLPWSVSGSITDLFLRSWTITDFTLGTVLDVAKKDSDVTVLSAPTLVTTHNREAFINAGESRPVITATDRDSTGLNSRSQVQFKDIGIQLKVKPLIGSNGIVQLEIEQTVESVVDEVLIDGNSQPVIGKREATSYITVGDGAMVVLGGLQEKTIREVGGRMAFLGDIPLLGDWMFSSERDRTTNRELIIFLKPTVFHTLDTYETHSKVHSERALENQPELKEFLNEKPTEEVPEALDAKEEGEAEKPRLSGNLKRRYLR
ncbi:MAG: hypothetical protein MI748_19995, partial [Opitutales bacterium]|nr:hypothetical protein [Opitutales bacterium]